MHSLLTIVFLVALFYIFIQFARQEYIQEFYEEIVRDIEGRMEWAKSRRFFPFGMRAQLDVSSKYLYDAKHLWKKNKWDQAYHTALESQEAMNRAQRIYSSVAIAYQKADKNKRLL